MVDIILYTHFTVHQPVNIYGAVQSLLHMKALKESVSGIPKFRVAFSTINPFVVSRFSLALLCSYFTWFPLHTTNLLLLLLPPPLPLPLLLFYVCLFVYVSGYTTYITFLRMENEMTNPCLVVFARILLGVQGAQRTAIGKDPLGWVDSCSIIMVFVLRVLQFHRLVCHHTHLCPLSFHLPSPPSLPTPPLTPVVQLETMS